MIYLIITTSINNKFGTYNDERKERYLYAISETLKFVSCKTIIVENNGKRDTYLDQFKSENVDVYYTDNNKYNFTSKGVNEMLDVKEVIRVYDIKDDDIIIKLTGRYRLLSPLFLNEINEKYDAFIKFYGVTTLKFEEYDCVLGCYAIRVNYLKLFNHLSMNNYKSAEVAFARYVLLCGARVNKINQLDIECSFSEDLRKLVV
jgi:hypothetical protein